MDSKFLGTLVALALTSAVPSLAQQTTPPTATLFRMSVCLTEPISSRRLPAFL
jgi:hypothetical protein